VVKLLQPTKIPGLLVVIDDDVAVQVCELHYPNISLA
jgi:hypothetical protein